MAASPAFELILMSVPTSEAAIAGRATCQKKPPAAEGDGEEVAEYVEVPIETVTLDDATDDHP